MWLPLALILVFCVCIYNQVGSAESRQGIETVPGSSDAESVTGFIASLHAGSLLFPFPVEVKILPLVTGSDAYPSVIVHGPPARYYPA